MEIAQINRGSTSIVVNILGIPEDRAAWGVTDDFLKGFAMHAAGEDPARLYGASVRAWGTAATVTLYTD